MTITNAPIGDVIVSRLNPRRLDPSDPTEKQKLEELLESVAVNGILQPLIGRRFVGEGTTDEGKIEICIGQRRLFVARRLDLEKVPVDIRDLTDAQMVAYAVTEQIQRVPLPPMQEAQALADLRAAGEVDDTIAQMLGKPTSYVRRRIALLNLAPKCARALEEGKLGVEHALLLADVPSSKAQEELLGATTKVPDGCDTITPKALREAILRDYVLELDSAPFDTNDPTLVPKAGACDGCPKSTATQPDLFALGAGPGGRILARPVCTDRDCWGGKVNAHLVVISKRDGREVLSAAQASAIFDPFGNVKPASRYVDLDAQCHAVTSASSAHGKPWRKAIGAKLIPKGDVVLAKSPTGRVVELLPERAAKALLLHAHPTQAATAPERSKKTNGTPAKPTVAERYEEKLAALLPLEALAELVKNIAGGGHNHGSAAELDIVRIAAAAAAFHASSPIPAPLKRVLAESWEDVSDTVRKTQSPDLAKAVLVAVLLQPIVEEDGLESSYLKPLLKHFSVKPKEIEKRLRSTNSVQV